MEASVEDASVLVAAVESAAAAFFFLLEVVELVVELAESSEVASAAAFFFFLDLVVVVLESELLEELEASGVEDCALVVVAPNERPARIKLVQPSVARACFQSFVMIIPHLYREI